MLHRRCYATRSPLAILMVKSAEDEIQQTNKRQVPSKASQYFRGIPFPSSQTETSSTVIDSENSSRSSADAAIAGESPVSAILRITRSKILKHQLWQCNILFIYEVIAPRIDLWLINFRFSKFLQLPVATASTVWANQRAEFKSFCNLIGSHGSRSCNRMLQELGKTLYMSGNYVR